MTFEMFTDKSWPFDMEAAMALLIIFHDNNQVLSSNCCMAANVRQHVCHLGRFLGFFENLLIANLQQMH